MSLLASRRLHPHPLELLLIIAAVSSGGWSSTTAAAGTASTRVAVAGDPATGSWQPHRYQFQYLAYNTTYGCQGLADKLRLLLHTIGARDIQANPVCLGHPSGPELVPEASLRFDSLQPWGETGGNENASGAGAAVPGTWRHITWAPDSPQTLGHGDCSLVQEVLKTVLPMFAIRDLHTKFDCAQNHDYGSFSVSFEAFAPADSH